MTEALVTSIRKAYRPELTVLVVEDHMVFSKEVKHALPQHSVVIARTLEDAKVHYDAFLPNITFLDIDLPDGNGFELLDYIRECEPEAYIIILTGSKLEDDVATSWAKGANGYVIKPFTRSKIEEYIEAYFALRAQGIQSLLEQTEQHRLWQGNPSGGTQ